MRLLIDYLGGEGTFDIIPLKTVDLLYSQRVLPLKVKFTQSTEFPESFRQLLQKSVEIILQQKHNAFQIDDMLFQSDELLTAGGNVINIVNSLKESTHELPWIEEFIKRIDMNKFEETVLRAVKHLDQLNDLFYYYTMDLTDCIIWFNIEMIPPHEGCMQQVYVLYANIESAQPKYFYTIDGKRPAFPVVWPQTQYGLKHFSVDPSIFSEEYADNEPALVYIQRHALQRLKERLDCLGLNLIQRTLCYSIQQCVAIKMKDNRVLIEYYHGKIKIGYLVAEYIDGAVLIHTFLFITANGTPEGQKLYKLSGLEKLDKKYLSIDKLSTFINSDISKNEELKSLFKSAGCDSLFEIEDALKDIATNQDELFIAESILKYLSGRNGNHRTSNFN